VKASNVWTHPLLGIGVLFGALIAGSFALLSPTFSADTPEAQQKKTRALMESARQRARKDARCDYGRVILAGFDYSNDPPLVLLIHCPQTNDYIFGSVRDEQKQDVLAIGLAAMSSGKHIAVDVVGAKITAIGMTEGPIDDR
jgi:hypothetical protein